MIKHGVLGPVYSYGMLLLAAALIAADIRIRNIQPDSFLSSGIDTLILLPIIVLIMFFPRTIAMAALLALYGVVLWYFPTRLVPVLILVGFVLPWYGCALLYRKVLVAMEEAGKDAGDA